MLQSFKGYAISSLDGGDLDGIHLIWTAPYQAGYSVDGYDIQRRDARDQKEENCHLFSKGELNRLHEQLRLPFPYGELAVRKTKCPTFSETGPDEPFNPSPPEVCIDFQSMPGATFPNPRIEQGVSFQLYGKAEESLRKKLRPLPNTEQSTRRRFHGLNGGHHCVITLEEAVDKVSIRLIFLAQAGTIQVYNSSDKLLQSQDIPEREEELDFEFSIPNIKRLVIGAPKNEWLLLKLCYSSKKQRCAVFSKSQKGPYPNPYTHRGFLIKVYDHSNELSRFTDISSWGNQTGLSVGYKTVIELPEAIQSLELTWVHFSVSPIIEILDLGTQSPRQLEQNAPAGKVQKTVLKGEPFLQSITIHAPQNELLLLSVCPLQAELAEYEEYGKASKFPQVNNPIPAAASYTNLTASSFRVALPNPRDCLCYEIRLKRMHVWVRVTAGYGSYIAIGLSEGKAVQVETRLAGHQPTEVLFENRFIDLVKIYTRSRLSYLQVCVDSPSEPEEEEQEWSQIPYIAKGIQLPLKNFNPALSNDSEENNLASSRLIGSESLEPVVFRDMADTLNPAGLELGNTSPMEYYTLTREQVSDPFIDLHTWPYGLSMVLNPTWRRILGFGFLDPDEKLVPGNRYDYRISGYFPRRDIEETLLSFRSVPEGTLLPTFFRMGELGIHVFGHTHVEYFPQIPDSSTRATARKGIMLSSSGFTGLSMRLRFSEPIQNLVLELEPGTMVNFRYETQGTDFFPGLGSLFADPVPTQKRVLLSFPEPIDQISFFGNAFLYGIRLNPIATEEEANHLVKQTVILYGVRFSPTATPPSPPFLGSQNLQQPAIVGDPQEIVENPRNDMGFSLQWLPPPSDGGSPIPWPEDLSAFPPFDALGFHLERRRVDTGEPFLPIEEAERDTLFMGARQGRHDPPQLEYGVDLLSVYPIQSRPRPPIPIFMDAQDVLFSSDKPIGVPGGLYQYRIYSVDILGRQSAVPTLGSVVRLEKRIAPPQPGSPNEAVVLGRIQPAGLRATVLQASDPELSEGDKLLLGDSTNAVLVEWGWSAEQRNIDPFTTEFRVYWQSVLPDQVRGTLTGSASLVGGLYQMHATLDQTVDANLLAGKYLNTGSYPFKIQSHTGGQVITFEFEPSALDTTQVPQAGDFVLNSALDGEELRPNRWQERLAIVPVTAATNYQYIIRNRLSPGPHQPLILTWVGVSSADDQYYIPDELASTVTNGGRPGNESSIAAAVVQARYYGQPVFTVPSPLADVPELATKEPVADETQIQLDLPSLYSGSSSLTIPAGYKVLLEYLPSAVLLNMIGATESDTIQASLPDGTVSTYSLPNPIDHADFLTQIRAGISSAIAGKFIMEFLIRFKTQLQPLWQRALPQPVPYQVVEQKLLGDPERFFYQVRLVDSAGHYSKAGAILPRIVRVRSIREPDRPQLELSDSSTDVLELKSRFRDQFDLKWQILFAHVEPINDPLDRRTLEKAQLLRIPNRMDLYPMDGLRIRLRDGTVLSPILSEEVSSGSLNEGFRELTTTLNLDPDQKVAVWAVIMTRDGIASRFVGPLVALTGPETLLSPTLTSLRSGRVDLLSWTPLLVPARISIERQMASESEWKRVSPWLPEGETSFSVVSPELSRSYRLRLKGRRNNVLTTAPLVINEP